MDNLIRPQRIRTCGAYCLALLTSACSLPDASGYTREHREGVADDLRDSGPSAPDASREDAGEMRGSEAGAAHAGADAQAAPTAGRGGASGGAGTHGNSVGSGMDAGRAELFADAVLWLAADRGVIVDSANRVTKWEDQSSYAKHAHAADAETAPVRVMDGDRPYLVFDGADALILPSVTGFTQLSIFVVAAVTDAGPRCPSFLHLSNSTGMVTQDEDIEIGRHEGVLYYECWNRGLPKSTTADAFTLGTPHVLSVVHTASAHAESHVDGVLAHSRDDMDAPTQNTRNHNFVGDNRYHFPDGRRECDPLKGRIAEIVLLKRAVTHEERSAIERDLSERWRVPLQ